MDEHLRADIGEPALDTVRAAIRPCEAVVHAAAALDQDPSSLALSRVNGFGTQQVLALARDWQARFVFISSIGVLGRPSPLPLSEDLPPRPETAYHASKLFGEQLTLLTLGPVATVLRLTSPLGPGLDPSRLAAAFARRAVAGEPLLIRGRGTRAQNFVDVRDIAEAVELTLRRQAEGIVNVAGRRSVTTQQLALLCRECLGSGSEIRFDGRPDPEDDLCWDVPIEKAWRRLGWQPQTELRQSLVDLAASFRDGRR